MTDTNTADAPTLTAKDRCCATANGSEAAQVMVWVTDGEPLLFCGHHYDDHAEVFAAKGYRVIDTRNHVPVNRQQGESYS